MLAKKLNCKQEAPNLSKKSCIRSQISVPNLGNQARKGNALTNFWSGYLAGGMSLPLEGVGVKTFGMSVETQGNQTFWVEMDFCWDILGALDKFEEQKFVCLVLL